MKEVVWLYLASSSVESLKNKNKFLGKDKILTQDYSITSSMRVSLFTFFVRQDFFFL